MVAPQRNSKRPSGALILSRFSLSLHLSTFHFTLFSPARFREKRATTKGPPTHLLARANVRRHEFCIQRDVTQIHEAGPHYRSREPHEIQSKLFSTVHKRKLKLATSSIPCYPSSCTRCPQASLAVSRPWRGQNLVWVRVGPK